MNYGAEIWWDFVTAVGRMRYLSKRVMHEGSTEELLELSRKFVEVDGLLDQLLTETCLADLYPEIIQPVDARHN